jgi:hypothetical protein
MHFKLNWRSNKEMWMKARKNKDMDESVGQRQQFRPTAAFPSKQ